MSAFSKRRDQDVQMLKELQEQSRERIRVTRVSGDPANEIDVELHAKTAPSKQYPRAVQDVPKLTISLPARYPFVEPSVIIRTPILHPNVYSSGRICLGMKWIPTFGLDLLVRRIVQIVSFDSAILNEASPANSEALTWYRNYRLRGRL
jgi:ubiquitin-protein ligase